MDLRAITPQFRKHIDGLVKLHQLSNPRCVQVMHPALGKRIAEFRENDPKWVADQRARGRRSEYIDNQYHIKVSAPVVPGTYMAEWSRHSNDLAELLEQFAEYLDA